MIEQASGVRSDRRSLQAGDFFKGDLPVCDAYLLMEVIHDWNDEDARKILKNVRSAAPAHAKLLIIEAIVAEAPGPSWPKTLDLWMLAIGGKQRTLQQYTELFTNAGFSFTRQIDTPAGRIYYRGDSRSDQLTTEWSRRARRFFAIVSSRRAAHSETLARRPLWR